MNLSELNFRDQGSLPGSVKFVVGVITVVIVCDLGYV